MLSDDDYYEDDIDADDYDEEDDYDQDEVDIDEGYLGDSVGDRIGSQRHSSRDEELFPYKCLSTDEVVDLMRAIIAEVNEIINIPSTTLRTLLAHYNWDKELLLEKYYEYEGNQERIFKEAHVISPFKVQGKEKYKDRISRRSAEEACEICYTSYTSSLMTGLACGHSFCKGCWAQYLTTKILDEGMSQAISCPEFECDIIVEDDLVMNLLPDITVRRKYQHLMTNSFVSCNALLRWCPAPDCHHVIKAEFRDKRVVKCDCGREFCFQCSEAWHDPVTCAHLRKWLKKCDDDSETSNWISANTKECPKCQVTIEKDGGCNHMVCRNRACKHEFCWVCLGSWDPHGASWYNCNRYNAAEAKKARDVQERSREMLQRYLFYCNRYMNHLQSLRFEHKLYARVKRKMEEMQRLNMSWIEVQFLKKAVDVLCQCRQTLMYTYVFAFFLQSNNQSQIFEQNQADLEKATETLSEYLERDVTTASMSEVKQKVQDKYRYCDSRRNVLLRHVHEGYDKDWWVYMEE